MANLLNAELPSDDEDDLDFDEVAEAKLIGEHDEDAGGKKKKQTRRRGGRLRGAGAVDADMDNGDGGEDCDEEDDEEDLVEARKASKEQAANQAKAADAWSLLNGGGDGRGGSSTKAKRQKMDAISGSSSKETAAAAAVDLDTLCRNVAKKKKEQARNKKADTSWMRQMGIAVGSNTMSTSNGSNSSMKKAPKKTAEELAAKAMAAVKEATASSVLTNASGMITIAETRRFAGKNITVEREVAKDSRDAKRAETNQVGRKKEGLDAVLAQIAPAKKVTVMDKSKSDWKEFKTNDDQILEELEAHKKSGATYIEKKDFLLAADVKQYEKERDQRLGADVRNRGRL